VAQRTGKVTVTLDGAPLYVDRGASLGEVLRCADVGHREGCIVAIERKAEEGLQWTARFTLSTSKGEIGFTINDPCLAQSLSASDRPHDITIRSVDGRSMAIGPLITDTTGTYRALECNEGDIILDRAGGERENTVLRFSKKKHSASYSIAGPSPVGHVVSGLQTLRKLGITDSVRLMAIEDAAAVKKYEATSDMNTIIDNDGTALFTKAAFCLDGPVPESVDRCLRRLSVGEVEVYDSTGSFVAIAGPEPFPSDERNPASRGRGIVSIRNSGLGQGRIYIYRSSRDAEVGHTVIGKVMSGMPLFDVAGRGDRIAVELSPTLLTMIGLTQGEAAGRLHEMGLDHHRGGCTEDDGLIVGQEPRFTLDIMKNGSATTIGVHPDDLVEIELYSEAAPLSVHYFRTLTGLNEHSVGRLEVVLPFSPISGAVLMKGESRRAFGTNLEPENLPTGQVKVGDVGMTNSVNSKMGMIGVRTQESDEFGPSSEVFDSTNIIGRVTESSLDKIKKKKGGSEFYVIEAGKSPSSLRPA
jgi:putative methanogenesis marker protein 3